MFFGGVGSEIATDTVELLDGGASLEDEVSGVPVDRPLASVSVARLGKAAPFSRIAAFSSLLPSAGSATFFCN